MMTKNELVERLLVRSLIGLQLCKFKEAFAGLTCVLKLAPITGANIDLAEVRASRRFCARKIGKECTP